MAFDPGTDGCLSIWAGCYAARPLDFPPHARVLEIGCAEADWMTPMHAERPDLQIIGIDTRDGFDRPGGTVITGNVLTYDFPPESFDAVVGISSIEHIGLTHYGDPADVDGDRHCMERVVGWLKPGGWVYADVPYHPEHYAVAGTSHRVYDDAALQERLLVPGLREVKRWFAPPHGEGLTTTPYQSPFAWEYAYVAIWAVKA